MVFDPFPGIPMTENTGRMSRWLAAEETISTHQLRCLLFVIERSCHQLQAEGAPIPIRFVYARRLVLDALAIRKALSRERRQ
ncbi:hypothetical protein [Chelativorans salis]|uniref:Uncharacterized protein n=1 Tax=Chelativorans salis TaxID=2978478 RepID=A0ABT2LHI3_9HYPH|nr:hypothetical protein [Chelativorans sp. EGI FJ00035]MCT7373950.1 hypothetical protein [Chelativorans sp. EGI FJ00035]